MEITEKKGTNTAAVVRSVKNLPNLWLGSLLIVHDDIYQMWQIGCNRVNIGRMCMLETPTEAFYRTWGNGNDNN